VAPHNPQGKAATGAITVELLQTDHANLETILAVQRLTLFSQAQLEIRPQEAGGPADQDSRHSKHNSRRIDVTGVENSTQRIQNGTGGNSERGQRPLKDTET
jgi:hypothetical protein